MGENFSKELIIDERFQRLTYPLDVQSLAHLETSILSGLCNKSLVVWNGCLIDGFGHYSVYLKHQLPFHIENKEFGSWEAAAVWICAQQLKRNDIPEELRRFLIGTQYLLEKGEAKLLCNGEGSHVKQYGSVCHRIAVRLGGENHVARATVQKYAAYAQALELIRERMPQAVENILSGHTKISHEKLVALSKLESQTFQQAVHQMETMRQPFFTDGIHQQSHRKLEYNTEKLIPRPSVKDMPAFDPDAEITGLTLTVPSWSGSIDRMIQKTDLTLVSMKAKERLISVLLGLQKKVSEALVAIEVAK